MKRFLAIGLIILIGTNIAVLSHVFINRATDTTTQLTLTERELPLPYAGRFQQENSGLSLKIKWRTPTKPEERYVPYGRQALPITEEALVRLGFAPHELKNNYWETAQELFWAFEFNGPLHQVEVTKAAKRYQDALASYQAVASQENKRKSENYKKDWQKEKASRSRLFVLEASASYQELKAKFNHKNKQGNHLLITKGLAKPYYNSHDNTYSLVLQSLSVNQIMVPTYLNQKLTKLNVSNKEATPLPRYEVVVHWGSQFEPWIEEIIVK